MDDRILELIDEEKERIIEEHGMFNSNHEAYAVLLEEVEEAKQEIINMGILIDMLWDFCKQDKDVEFKSLLSSVSRCAKLGIQELVQVSAVCEKAKEL